MTNPRVIVAAAVAVLASSMSVARAADKADTPLEDTRIRGGLCVIVGSTDTRLAAEVARGGSFVVQCLARDADQVDGARAILQKERLYGKVTVEAWGGDAFPYADNLVALLIVLDPGKVGEAELWRVVRPFGEMMVRQDAHWRTITKPLAEGLDEWTHWRHGPDRNPVSADKLVDVPECIQWLFTVRAISERSHFLVANGRAFAQDRDLIIARDAGSGLPLWKTKIKVGKEFDWEYAVKVAALIASRGERVYALADDGRLKALDAATGRPVEMYEEAGTPFDIVVADDGASRHGTIVVLCPNAVRTLDAASGALLWKQDAHWPHNLIVSRDAAFFIEGNDRRGGTHGVIFARGLRSGELLWKRDYYWARRTELGGFGYDHLVYEVRPPFNWREFYEQRPDEKQQDNYRLVVISAKTGQEVQKLENVGSSARHGEFFRGFWIKEQLLIETQTREGLGIGLFNLGEFSKPAAVFKANYVGDKGWGHCYPPVLTDRYYINGQLNFTDLRTRKQVSNQITRGACNTAREGYIPAYGMIYTFPKHCVCFPMLDGNVCLAPAYAPSAPESCELKRGPAWPAQPEMVVYAQDWPTFRHDAWRSGGTDTTVPAKLDVLWEAEIPGPDYQDPIAAEWLDSPFIAGPVTAPVVGQHLVLVAQSDTHRLFALDAQTGKRSWEFVAGGRIDGPPTLHQGLCLFGCRDGWVYSVRAKDGVLIWKLRLAPRERRISIYGQVESPWAVPGSVLVADGLGYACGGLHPNADGGIRVVCFQPATGEIVWQNKFDNLGMGDPWPAPHQPGPDRDPWRSIWPKEYRYFDLPVRDGEAVAISRCLFDLKTGQRDLRKTSGSYFVKDTGVHLPRTAWHYANVRNHSPVAVSRGHSVFTSVPGVGKLFRVDFEKSDTFDPEWVAVSKEQSDTGMWTATSKLFQKGAKWAVASEETKTAFNRALLVAAEHLFIVTPKGDLVIRSAEDGGKLAELRPGAIIPDGIAAARGRLFATTETGRLLCLGATIARPPITTISPPEKEFFAKKLMFHGLPIKASAEVVDEALYAAHDRLAMMLRHLPSIVTKLVAAGVELHIIGRNQVTTDLPEWRHDKGAPLAEYQGKTRDERTRGMGGRLVSCGEENLLKLHEDRYRGRDICLHEFAHAVRAYGMAKEVRARFDSQYQRSLDAGRWKGSYAGSNKDEFFAELTMWYFGTHGDLGMTGLKPDQGPDGLKRYDPAAFALFDDFFAGRLEVR